jgi:hypothetical protein
MEAIKAETEDEDMVPTQPIDIPAPAPTDMQLMLRHMAEMEERLKPKPKQKKKATEKQAAALERARAARAVTTLERNKLKKELKARSKITEKKFVDEGLAQLKSPDKVNAVQDSSDVPANDKPDVVPVNPQPIHKSRPDVFPDQNNQYFNNSNVKSLKDFKFR